MAYTGFGVAEYDAANKLEVVRDVSALIPEVLRRKQGVLPHMKSGGTVYNTEFEWFERDWVPFQWASDTDLTTATSNIAITFTAGQYIQKYINVGDVFRVVGSTLGTVAPQTEYFLVVSVDSDTQVTFSRQALGTTTIAAPVTTNGLIWEKLGARTEEGSTQGAFQLRPYGPPRKNWTQIMRFDMKETNTAKAIKLYGVSDFWGTNLRENTEELALSLDRTVMYGRAPSSSQNVTPRTMAGIKQLLTENTLGTVYSGANLISSGYTVPNEELLNALVRMVIAKNGQFNNGRALALMSAANYEIICDIWKDKINITRDDTVRGVQVKSIITKLGITLDLEWSPQILNSDLFLLNPTKLELVTLAGRTWNLHTIADVGVDAQQAYTVGEYSLRVWDAFKDHALCNCLTTTS